MVEIKMERAGLKNGGYLTLKEGEMYMSIYLGEEKTRQIETFLDSLPK